MFGAHCLLIFLEHALSEASKDTGVSGSVIVNRLREAQRPTGWCGAPPPSPSDCVDTAERPQSVAVPRNETLLNPEEKPQEEKNTAQLQLGLRLQPSSHLLPAQRVCLQYRPGGKVCQSGTALQVPKDPSDREECGLGTMARPTPALKPEVGGGQSSPWGRAAVVSPQGLWVHGEPEAAVLEGRPELPRDRRDPTGREVGEVTAEGAPEFKGSQKELLVLPQTYLFCVCHLSWGAPTTSARHIV